MMFHRHKIGVAALLCFLIVGLTATAAQGLDHSLYAGLLKKYVNHGAVNYQGFKNAESVLDQYLKKLQKVDSKMLSRNEQFAFYINAYNAWTIKLILSGYPGVKSIKELGTLFKSPWKKKICRIDGKIMTLDDIEHGILRPEFKDPRVHFAINCAAKSCPPLRSEPYHGDALDQQLDEMTGAFINHLESNRLENHMLYVSSIFKWFKEDFNNDIIGFFLKYAKGDLKGQLEADKEKIKVKYLDYNWSLNGK
ncbi:MAG: DUF547 domain-containing protein [Thermodesulfobacteriota bacterium]|nr:DUF547 domain-containing protein [Thermodesulfobacteriota bacterium]